MKKTFVKKSVAWLLTLVMVIGFTPVTGFAEGDGDAGEGSTDPALTSEAPAADNIEVRATRGEGDETYYVITMENDHGNYALSREASTVTYTNSQNVTYSGRVAVYGYEYDPNESNDNILWTLEEAPDTENGYYIKSKLGGYLSATYGNNQGTLVVGDTQDIWIVDDGLEAWLEGGSTLQSTNANGNDYLTITYASKNNPDPENGFFTVRSESNAGTIKLNKPPVLVTGVEVEPSELTVEIGKVTDVTANVIPENADDKNVTWTSSDNNVATVNNSGEVTGVSLGTTTITATTNDGGFTDTCTVTVTPSTSPGIGYVITIDGYALTDKHSSNVFNSGGVAYYGLSGKAYDGSSDPTEDILWLITPTEGGY